MTQLKTFYKSIADNKIVQEDILDLSRSGDLSTWLDEHGETEMSMKISHLNESDIEDSKYISALLEFMNVSSPIKKPAYSSCFSIEGINCKVIEDSLKIEFKIIVKDNINETYTIRVESLEDNKKIDFNPNGHPRNSIIPIELTLLYNKESYHTEINFYIDDVDFLKKNVYSSNATHKLFVSDKKEWPGHIFYLCDINGRDYFSKEKFITIFSTLNICLAKLEESNELFLISQSSIQPITTLKSKQNVETEDNNSFYIYENNKCISKYFIDNNQCIEMETFLEKYCQKFGLAYYSINHVDIAKIFSIHNNKEIKISGYKSAVYLGNYDGKELFLASKHYWGSDYRIVDTSGETIQSYDYNGPAMPIGENNYIVLNTGHKYTLFAVYSIDGNCLAKFKVKNGIKLSYLNNLDNSYILNDTTRYIKSDKQLISCITLNEFLYIKNGYYSGNNYNPNDCRPSLHSCKTDEKICDLKSTYHVNLGSGFVAVTLTSEDNYSIVSPLGEIVYTLKKDEIITEDYPSYYRENLSPIGKSEVSFIVKKGKKTILVYSFIGKCVFTKSISNNEQIVGYNNEKLFVIVNHKIAYYDLSEEKHVINWKGKVDNKEDIIVLPNDYILISPSSSNNSNILIDLNGETILENKKIQLL